MSKMKLPSVMFEMLRSFATVSETLNISKAVAELGFTRQTIRRHLDDLEELLGFKLFKVTNRQYSITEEGKECLKGVQELLEELDDWVVQKHVGRNELARIAHIDEASGFFYFCEQQKLLDVWDHSMPLMQAGLAAWSQSEGRIEHEAFDKIKPYLILNRKNRSDWICTFVGETSSYATWLGITWAKSAIGQAIEDDPSMSSDRRFIIKSYDTVFEQGIPKYDHIYGQYAREEHGEMLPVSFQRLVLPLKLPNNDSVLGVLVGRTNNININLPEGVTFVPTLEEETMDGIMKR